MNCWIYDVKCFCQPLNRCRLHQQIKRSELDNLCFYDFYPPKSKKNGLLVFTPSLGCHPWCTNICSLSAGQPWWKFLHSPMALNCTQQHVTKVPSTILHCTVLHSEWRKKTVFCQSLNFGKFICWQKDMILVKFETVANLRNSTIWRKTEEIWQSNWTKLGKSHWTPFFQLWMHCLLGMDEVGQVE